MLRSLVGSEMCIRDRSRCYISVRTPEVHWYVHVSTRHVGTSLILQCQRYWRQSSRLHILIRPLCRVEAHLGALPLRPRPRPRQLHQLPRKLCELGI
eukprot:TRINITY_DN62192_c0_g1_i1.p2 TRINITY_DN62192_c0_g1~~TRINITY_DN62192_c0_g1_i1.p2  ORF type:complete len:110 (-),score=12.33 TRINITY_DN62192_c0_g1_i1:86-376(-)